MMHGGDTLFKKNNKRSEYIFLNPALWKVRKTKMVTNTYKIITTANYEQAQSAGCSNLLNSLSFAN